MSVAKADRSLVKILEGKATGTLAIFERQENYACYGGDARLVASAVFRSEAGVKTINLQTEKCSQQAYLPLTRSQFQRVVREALTIMRYRVELYAYDSTTDDWCIKAKGTIGNAGDFEDIVGETLVSGTFSIMITDGVENRVSLCYVDVNELTISVAEFIDSPEFHETERILLGLCPYECLILQPFPVEKKKKLLAVLKKLGILQTEYDSNAARNAANDAMELIKPGDKTRECATSLSRNVKDCFSAIVAYLKLTEEGNFTNRFSLSNHVSRGFVYIDTAAVEALELFHLFHSMSDNKSGSTLYGLLNKCATAAGQRLLREWIVRPLSDIRLLEERQDAVSALFESGDVRETLRSKLLARVPDCSNYARKFLQGRAKLQDCYRVYQAVMILPQIEKSLNTLLESNEQYASAIKELMLEPIVYASANFVKYVDLINSTIEEDGTGSYRVKPCIDPNLQRIDEEMREISRAAEKLSKKVAASLGFDQLKLDKNDQLGFFFKVALKADTELRKAKNLEILETSKSQGIKFRTDELAELSRKYLKRNRQYQQTQSELSKEILSVCATFAPTLCQLNSALSTLDVLVSLASVAANSVNSYVRPKLLPSGSGILQFNECRHPVMEAFLDKPFIPNNVDLSGDDKRLLVLTGSNMGGKSTYLRAAALCALMAQIGSFVPATSATVSLLDGIFTRIGASDQQTRGVSTFMAEMTDCSNILSLATPNSMVIVDELGRGTSTFDGFGLAWGIASHILKETRCFCLFATHFHEMSSLAREPGAFVKQMSVMLCNGKLTMLYELQDGVAASSFGIEVAKMVGLPEEVVENSRKVLAELEDEKTIIERLKKLSGEELRAALLAEG